MATIGAPQTIINQDVTPQDRPRLTAAEVDAQWRQNLGGGIGASIVVLVLVGGAWLAVGVSEWPQAAAITSGVALAAGALVFGGLMLFRSFVDELMDWQAYRDMCADLERYEADLQAAEGTIAAQGNRLEDLQRENGMLRFRLENGGTPGRFVSADPEPTEDAGADMRKMIEVAYSGGGRAVHPGKATMKAWGWSESKHAAAYAGLKARGVVTGSDNRPQWPATEAEAVALLTAPAVVE